MPERKVLSFFQYLTLFFINLVVLVFCFNLKQFDITTPLHFSGDLLAGIAIFKTIIIGDFPFYLYPSSQFLSAPFSMEMGDYPMPMLSIWVIIRGLGFFTSNPIVVFNIFVLFTYFLTPITTFFILKRLKIGISISILVATLYNFLPFHFQRIGHWMYIGYFFIPIWTYCLLLLWRNKPLFFKRTIENKYTLDLSNKNIMLILVLLFSSTWNYYYTFFFILFLAIVFLSAYINSKNKFQIYSILIVLILLIVPFFVNMLPYKYYEYIHGKNTSLAQRGVNEAETYGLKISQMLLPIDYHRLSLFQKIKEKTYNNPLINENRTATLGIIGSFGFLILCLILLKNKSRSTTTLNKLSHLMIFGLLFATIGGGSSLFATLISSSIRGYNRISIFLAFLCFLAVAIILNYYFKRYKIKNLFVICFFLGILGILDITNSTMSLKQAESEKQQFLIYKEFINRVEDSQKNILRPMVMQYPLMYFPEAAPVHNMQNYEPIKAFVLSNRIAWSFGSAPGREAYIWQKKLLLLSCKQQIEILEASGFSGLYIDTRGYVDKAENFMNELITLLNQQPIKSKDGNYAFFTLQPKGTMPISIWKFNTLPEIEGDFYGWEGNPGLFGWAKGALTIPLYGSQMSSRKNVVLKFTVGSLSNREIKILFNKRIIENIKIVIPERKEISLNLVLEPNHNNLIELQTDQPPVFADNGDPRQLSFFIGNMQITE